MGGAPGGGVLRPRSSNAAFFEGGVARRGGVCSPSPRERGPGAGGVGAAGVPPRGAAALPTAHGPSRRRSVQLRFGARAREQLSRPPPPRSHLPPALRRAGSRARCGPRDPLRVSALGRSELPSRRERVAAGCAAGSPAPPGRPPAPGAPLIAAGRARLHGPARRLLPFLGEPSQPSGAAAALTPGCPNPWERAERGALAGAAAGGRGCSPAQAGAPLYTPHGTSLGLGATAHSRGEGREGSVPRAFASRPTPEKAHAGATRKVH